MDTKHLVVLVGLICDEVAGDPNLAELANSLYEAVSQKLRYEQEEQAAESWLLQKAFEPLEF